MDKQMMYLAEGVDLQKDLVYAAERHIWENPETGYKEWKTNEYLSKIFQDMGYDLTFAGNIPGFYTVLDTGRPGPTVCVFAEMDALVNELHPECDPSTSAVHSCGHHMQQAAILGLAGSLKRPGALDGMSGKIMLCAVPAEELIELDYRQGLIDQGTIRYLTGKAEFLGRGYLDGVDMALMIHGGGDKILFSVLRGLLGSLSKSVTIHGVAGHAASPHRSSSVNAVYAATQALSACNALREKFKEGIRWHPIIPECSPAVNSIPDRVVLESMVRGIDLVDMAEANKLINRAIAGSAASIGATATVSDQIGYMPTDCNEEMTELFCESHTELFPDIPIFRNPNYGNGSADLGFLSAVMPVTQAVISGGAVGVGHGADYFVRDPLYCCMNGAKTVAALLWKLLKDDAAKARHIKETFQPKYNSRDDLLHELDLLNQNKELVTLQDDSTITLSF